MAFYRRRLPHWHPSGVALFVTFRLAGSLPRHRAFRDGDTSDGQAFVAMDRLLDTARSGPMYLRRVEAARVVVDSLRYGAEEMGHYELDAFVVMPNHVHMLVLPKVPVAKLMLSLKRATAQQVNRLINRTGKRFWQEEYFDRWVRYVEEYERIVRYIENNPVAAGLCREAGEWRWSSAFSPKFHALAGAI